MRFTHSRPHPVATALAALSVLAALTGCQATQATTGQTGHPHHTSHATRHHTAPAPTSPGAPAPAGTALAALNALPVKGRAPMTGYSRDQFGQEWSDAAGNSDWTRNGCDTRNDLLARDLQRETVESNGCVVISGVLAYEPYTGARNVQFVAGGTYEQSLDAEHLVALGSAWVTGAQQISAEQRAALANDPINLYLADPSSNRSKGDADFATWLPPNKAFRCSYAARQIRVKQRYGLWVTAPEKAAMERVLATCPNEPLVQPEVQAGYTAGEPTQQPAQQSSAIPTPAATSGGSNGGSVYYANCDAVRAAGAAPIRRGDPGYSTSLDRDGDGSACE